MRQQVAVDSRQNVQVRTSKCAGCYAVHLGKKNKKKTLFLTFESDQMFELNAVFVHREVDDLNSSLEACETLAAIFSPIIQFCFAASMVLHFLPLPQDSCCGKEK